MKLYVAVILLAALVVVTAQTSRRPRPSREPHTHQPSRQPHTHRPFSSRPPGSRRPPFSRPPFSRPPRTPPPRPPPRQRCASSDECAEDECCVTRYVSEFRRGMCLKLGREGSRCTSNPIDDNGMSLKVCPCSAELECIAERTKIIPEVGEIKINERCRGKSSTPAP